jgi:hypothetical protein
MSSYIKLKPPLDLGETAPLRGAFERVYSLDDATRMGYSDAEYFRVKAFETWPAIDWKIEKAGGDYYVVRGG